MCERGVCVCGVQREGIRSCSSQAFLQYVGTRTVLQITERSASSRRFSPVRPVVIGRLIKEEERKFFEESVPQLDLGFGSLRRSFALAVCSVRAVRLVLKPDRIPRSVRVPVTRRYHHRASRRGRRSRMSGFHRTWRSVPMPES